MKTVHCRAGKLYPTAIKYEERLKDASSVELLECFIESKTKQKLASQLELLKSQV